MLSKKKFKGDIVVIVTASFSDISSLNLADSNL